MVSAAERRKRINDYLKRIKAGEDVFDEFYRYTYLGLEYIARLYLRNKSYVDDVVISAYAHVAERIHQFDDTQNGYAWLFKITQNEALKTNRDNIDNVALNENRGKVDYEDRRLEKMDMYDALGRLDELEHKIVEMYIFNDTKFVDIAQELDMPLSTVHYHYKCALKFLYNSMNE